MLEGPAGDTGGAVGALNPDGDDGPFLKRCGGVERGCCLALVS